MSKSKRPRLPGNQDEWDALREEVVAAAYGYATAVDETMPIDYPGPKMVAAFTNYVKRVNALQQGLLDFQDKWGMSE